MTTQADFTTEEWNIILQAPAFAALYVLQSGRYSRPVAHQKMAAGIKAIFDPATHGAGGALVCAVRSALQAGQHPANPDAMPADLAEARQLTIEGCRHATILLAQRTSDAESTAYADWLLAIGEAVAAVVDDSPTSGYNVAQVAEHARLALENLATILTGGRHLVDAGQL